MKLAVEQHEGAFGTLPSKQENETVIDTSELKVNYCNASKITGSPEELIFEFGLHPAPYGGDDSIVEYSQRIVANFVTVKGLLLRMDQVVAEFEQAHGEIETDPEKRIRNR